MTTNPNPSRLDALKKEHPEWCFKWGCAIKVFHVSCGNHPVIAALVAALEAAEESEAKLKAALKADEHALRTLADSMNLTFEPGIDGAGELVQDAIKTLAATERLLEARTEALRELVKVNEDWNAAVESIIGRPPNWTDGYLDRSRDALSLTVSDMEEKK